MEPTTAKQSILLLLHLLRISRILLGTPPLRMCSSDKLACAMSIFSSRTPPLAPNHSNPCLLPSATHTHQKAHGKTPDEQLE